MYSLLFGKRKKSTGMKKRYKSKKGVYIITKSGKRRYVSRTKKSKSKRRKRNSKRRSRRRRRSRLNGNGFGGGRPDTLLNMMGAYGQ